ncbi:MAG: hypothetical protein HGA22_02355 [Clostridiales bacterium]|nr:hypothetical protein [Clostridiales bacterium]
MAPVTFGSVTYPLAVFTQPIHAPDLDSFSTASLTPGSDRYFMWVSNGAGNSFSSGYGNYFGFGNLSTEFAEKIIEANYKIIAVCPTATYDYDSGLDTQDLTIRGFVNSSMLSGMFYDSGQYQAAISALQTTHTTPGDNIVSTYAIVNEDVLEYKTYYNDYENDPVHASCWRYDHTPGRFDNSTITAGFSGVKQASPLSVFTLPGMYEITNMVRDNPKTSEAFDEYKLWSKDAPGMNVYAHRRPTATFSMGFTSLTAGSYTSVVADNSYDPDHTSQPGRGIASTLWRWKNIKADTWTSGTSLPTSWTAGETYMISLVVTDIEGAASLPFVITLDTDEINLMPSIDCNPVYRNWSNTNAAVTIKAVDETPDLYSVQYAWSLSVTEPSSWTTLSAAATPGFTASSFSTSVTAVATGVYYLHMKAVDSGGNVFYRVRGPYCIDKEAPSVDCTPTTASITAGDVAVTVTAADTGGSGLYSIACAWSESGEAPSAGWNTRYPAAGATAHSFLETLEEDGTFYLFMRVTDVAGNTSTAKRGPFTRTSLDITGVTLKGSWNHWRGQTDIFGEVMTIEPHRFLSYETVGIKVVTTGRPDRVSVRFSPELEAMYYTDSKGYSYSYLEDTGAAPEFPLMLEETSENNYYAEYILPLAASTKSIDGTRLGESYWMLVTAVKGGVEKTWLVNDLEISGNIWDETYIQPVVQGG